MEKTIFQGAHWSVYVAKYYSDYQINNEMGGKRSTYGEKREMLAKLEGKRQLGRSRDS